MVRGHAKEVAQAKNQAKKDASKKGGSQLGMGAKKTNMTCPICKVCALWQRSRGSRLPSAHAAPPRAMLRAGANDQPRPNDTTLRLYVLALRFGS